MIVMINLEVQDLIPVKGLQMLRLEITEPSVDGSMDKLRSEKEEKEEKDVQTSFQGRRKVVW